jgi:general secretion pathway protein F
MDLQFQVKRVSRDRQFEALTVAGLSAEAVRAEQEEAGHLCISVTPLGFRAGKSSAKFSLLIFCQQLLSLLEAGLQLVEALAALAEKEAEAHHSQVLAQVSADLKSGLSFSASLRNQPAVFPAVLQAAIAASERTGDIQDAIRRFVAYEAKFQGLKSKLKSALIYPVTLLGLGGMVSLFLLGYVVPRFATVFADRLDDMPYLSGLVIRAGLLISEHPWWLLALLCATVLAVYASFRQPLVRDRLLASLRQLPGIGGIMSSLELIRMYRALGMLLKGGIPAVQALEMAEWVTTQHTRSRLQLARELIREGRPFSHALKVHSLLTPVSERLVVAGERSGQMAEMLTRAADFLDFELEQTLDRAAKLLEPVLMVLIGGIIGGIVILMYLPIFELADSF